MEVKFQETNQCVEVEFLSPGETFYYGSDLCMVLDRASELFDWLNGWEIPVIDLDDGNAFILRDDTMVNKVERSFR